MKYKYTLIISLFLWNSCQEVNDNSKVLLEKPIGKNLSTHKDEILIEDSTAAFPSFFEGCFDENTIAYFDNEKFTFKKLEMGLINISSGKIIACDPITIEQAKPYIQDFPIGKFPIEVALIENSGVEKIHAVRIVFSDQKIVNWEYALLPNQKQTEIGSEEYYGYSVDGNSAILIDNVAAQEINDNWSHNDWENVFIKQFWGSSSESYYTLLYDFSPYNVAVFSTGLGDGVYASYVGKDQNENIVQLMTNFDIIPWWDLQKKAS